MQPPRHALGALLLEQGEVVEAATVFAADLAAHPGGNVWALHGLAECEERGAPIALPTPPTDMVGTMRHPLGRGFGLPRWSNVWATGH